MDFGLYVSATPRCCSSAAAGRTSTSPSWSRATRRRSGRRVPDRRARARPRPRHDQGDGADRDRAGRVRDGRDPVRAARPRRRSQRRALDYIFSMIKRFRSRPEFVLPNRSDVTMTVPFMHAYSELLVKTCHERGAHTMGGMSAVIPSRTDEEANRKAFEAVRADKEREAGAGFDGTWSRTPTRCGSPRRLSTRSSATGRTRSTVAATTCPWAPWTCCRWPRRPASSPRRGCA